MDAIGDKLGCSPSGKKIGIEGDEGGEGGKLRIGSQEKKNRWKIARNRQKGGKGGKEAERSISL